MIILPFRSGVLQVGDRVLAINGHILEGMTLEDARSIIRRSNHQIHLELEFDVTGRAFSSVRFSSYGSIRFGDALFGHLSSENSS